ASGHAAAASVALLRSATSSLGCRANVNESFPLIAAALDQNLRLEIDAAAFDIVTYVIAVLLGCQPSCCPFAGINLQARDAYVFWRGLVRYLKAFLEELVSLRLASTRVSLKKVLVVPQPRINRLL